MRSKFKVTTWVQHSVNSHPFRSMSIGHPIPELRLFQNLTLKIRVKVMGEVKVESHNMGPTFNRLTSLSFHVDQASQSWVTTKFDLENKGSKVMGEATVQSHNVGLTSYRLTSLSFYVKRASHSWVTTFLKIWPWKSRVKVMGGVTVQSHNVGLTSYRFTSLSFHVNRPSHF